MRKIIINAENVCKTYDEKNIVLENVNLRVYEKDFISILGESGSGKSTLLSVLGGMDTVTSGKVWFDGIDLATLKEKDLAKLRRTKLGFVFQFFNLAPYLTVEENIMLPLMLDGKPLKDYSERIKELMNYLKISDIAKKMPTKLSGGEQQRVAIARGLIYEPQIIFLDEPTGNLDSKNSDEIMLLLRQINQELNTTILQVTHSEKNALYGNRIIRIADGKVFDDSVLQENSDEHDLQITNENTQEIEETMQDGLTE